MEVGYWQQRKRESRRGGRETGLALTLLVGRSFFDDILLASIFYIHTYIGIEEFRIDLFKRRVVYVVFV